jgi:lipopolysaccharide/colanic/teichoic acid biosynthesis glycosyltransferase
VKRLTDFAGAGLALLCLSPLMFIVSACIRLTSAGPAIFKQDRLGKDGAPFRLYKFRTMYAGAPELRGGDGANLVVTDDPRLTRIGRFLRNWSLDEMPQLVNVLTGQMSLVGPRPDQVSHLPLYSEADKRKLAMRPGLTGLAMVSGRNDLPWKERIRLDVWYVEHHTLRLDIRILLRTIPVWLGRQGVYSNAGVQIRSTDSEDDA